MTTQHKYSPDTCKAGLIYSELIVNKVMKMSIILTTTRGIKDTITPKACLQITPTASQNENVPKQQKILSTKS